MHGKVNTMLGLLLLVAIGCFSISSSLTATTADNQQSSSGDDAALTQSDGKAPQISFPEREFDFGTISQQSRVSHTFVVQNTGDAPLKLISAKGSCGCTAALISDDLIPPGGEGKIEVTFSTGHRKGQQSKTVTVASNDPVTPSATVHISAVVETHFGFHSSSLYMDKVRPGQTVSKVTYLEVKDPRGVEVTNIETSAENITARVLDDPQSSEEGRIPIEITVKPGLPFGRYNGSITVTSNVDSLPSATLQITGAVVGDVDVDPETIRFVIMKSAENSVVPAYEKVKVTNYAEGRALNITGIVDPEGILDIEKQIVREGEEYTLLIKPRNPEMITDSRGGTIRITTDNPDQKELMVHYSIIQQ